MNPHEADYRLYVGPRERWSLVGPAYLDMLDDCVPGWDSGNLLDIGCGGLRIGKDLMPRLARGAYCGIEPTSRVVQDALAVELDGRIPELYAPRFSHNSRFDVSVFDCHFPVVIAYAVFIHCGRVQLRQFLTSLRHCVGEHSLPTSLVLDLRIEETPREHLPPSGVSCYRHASHNISSYVVDEVPTILADYGARLVRDDMRPVCDDEGIRRQHLVIFEP